MFVCRSREHCAQFWLWVLACHVPFISFQLSFFHKARAAVNLLLFRCLRVRTLQVGLVIAGAKERGELENRVTRLVAECKDAGDVVLM